MTNVRALPAAASAEVGLVDAIVGFLAAVDLAASTVAVYEVTLERFLDDLGNLPLAAITKAAVRRHLTDAYGGTAPATFNRNLATLSSLFAWCVENELVHSSPTRGIRRRTPKKTVEAERRARPVLYAELAAVWGNTAHSIRDRVLWAMAYDTAARADELLGLDIENIDTANREAVIIGKGGNAERIYWSSTTARLLPRLLTWKLQPWVSGPLFIGDRRPRSHLAPATADLCPVSGHARLSYRRAEELWKQASGGHTLHQLRHSRLTHLAEAGEDVTMIKAKSRHRSLRSLERYVNPSSDAIRDLTNRHDPNRRGR
ncbi:MAG: tyrosine-type recombinase/integrase [Acidimicrobiales bacterium]